MKNLRICLSVLLVSLSPLKHARADIDCSTIAPIPTGTTDLLNSLEAVSNGLYKDIAKMQVNHDGEGKLSVFYEKGEPKILKLTYKNDSGTTVKQVTFEDLLKGKPLVYENPDKPGKAIVLEKGSNFKSGNYDFKLKIRSRVSPEEFQTYSINFDSSVESPRVSYNKKDFSKMVISPGISMFSWDGTFKKVEFKN